jgi:hypothetical protein
LRRAILIKGILNINSSEGPEASLLKFILGLSVEVPDMKPDQAHAIDPEVARYFFHSSEHF